MNKLTFPLLISFLLLPLAASADSIRVDGTWHEDVLVREGENRYYIQLPDTGTTISVSKSEISPADIRRSNDPAHRQTLENTWRENRPISLVPQATSRFTLEDSLRMMQNTPSTTETPVLELRGNNPQPAHLEQHSIAGTVPFVSLQNVELADALDAILRPMGLDYEVRGNIIYIASPPHLREGTARELEQRIYQLHESSGAALPKIVLQTIPAAAGGRGGFGGGNFAGGGGGFGNFGGNMAGGRAGGLGGGLGGGGFGGGGMGGGGGFGNMAGVTVISNISDLFTTIDDRLVGETPAIIGMQGW